MRLIDADELPVDAQYTRSDGVTVYVPAVPCHYIKLAPTVDAIPRERIEQMIEEIEKLPRYAAKFADGESDIHISRTDLIAIIHKYTNASENSGQYDTFTKEQTDGKE